jgi:hypothetical protein
MNTPETLMLIEVIIIIFYSAVCLALIMFCDNSEDGPRLMNDVSI